MVEQLTELRVKNEKSLSCSNNNGDIVIWIFLMYT